MNRYADVEDLARLRQLLGAYAGVPQDQVIVGPGLDILLREMIHAFAGERKVIMVSPSFLPTLEAARETAAWWVGARLRDSGVLVLDASNKLPPGFIRVSIGTREENDAFLDAVKQIEDEDEDPAATEETLQ